MGGNEINVTYETLFELLRREKNREELQKLSDSFFIDVVEYIKEKEALLQQQKDSSDIFSAEETQKIKSQLDNIRKIVKELYDKREKKIIELALIKSRTKSGIIDTSNLLKEETVFFERMTSMLDGFRKDILISILNSKEPCLSTNVKESTATGNEKDEKKGIDNDNSTVLIRFLHAVPKFCGEELEVYGPFEAEDIANLPKNVADVLITKGRAEKMDVE